MAEERRLATVLFADVVGSTALGESLDPEDVRAILARLFGVATDAVERHGGRVEKVIDALDRLGDIEQVARVAAERRAAALSRS